ncbi:MAG TPA: DUF433 domain-containing protein [Candidatus Limnocylindria bacterium]|nr:DUF433 domain-containing protein [Candidatus Limnocylindria bacterium]
MTIKWVKIDPLVMNGEPFCYATRLTVRNLLEMRANGLNPSAILADNPELRRVGIAEAFHFAVQNRERYSEFFEGGALRGPGFSADEAMAFPEHLRDLAGIVVTADGGQR